MTGRFRQPIWLIPLTVAGLVALLGWWGNQRLRASIDEQLKTNLTETLDANVTALEIWTTNQMRIAGALAEEPTVVTTAGQILSSPFPERGAETPAEEQLGVFLRPRLARVGYETAQLVNTNFIVAAISGRGRFGVGQPVSEAHTNKFAELFETDQPVIITPFKPDMLLERRQRGGENFRFTNNAAYLIRANRLALSNRFRNRRGNVELMQVAAPIRFHGRVQGALALIINPTNEFSRVLSVARNGESGETFAFDQSGLMISESRFDDQLKALGLLEETNGSSALNLRLFDPGGDLPQGYKPEGTNSASESLTHIVASAVAGTDGVDVTPSRDYRGVPVVGAWRWLPQLGIGIATETEASEAFWLLRVLQLIFIVLFLLLVLCAVTLFIFSYANLTWRRRLNEAELKLKQLGQYTLEEKIGEGSMGAVYRARHALMRRDTAVKLLLPDRATPGAIAWFEREVHLTCNLAHPNTIQIYDYGHTPEGVFYYAMEFLNGLNLRQLVEQFGPQPEGRVINILTQVCNSLAEAHALGLVHRDIKPSNIFISNRGGVPDYVKVLDFGLVREYRGDETMDAGEVVGTPWFMPPESIQDPMRSDPRSDLYAVGAMAYYLLTAKYVFDHESAAEVFHKQLNEAPVPPSQATSNPVSLELEQIVLRCLEKDPGQRPQSALELAALLSASPHATDSTPEARAEWWVRFDARRGQTAILVEAANESPMPKVKVDFDTRMEDEET